MRSLCAFLLQTLTASGAAAVLLVVKRLLRDKLPPRWQFSVWAVLAAVMLIPAGLGRRYALINWPLVVETIKTALFHDFTITKVTAPVPLPPKSVPKNIGDWLFVVYFMGVVVLMAQFIVQYAWLRSALRRAPAASDETTERISAVAERFGLPTCRAVELTGTPSAFVCGAFRPILVLPAGERVDDKVILHELMHLKRRDVIWGPVICFFRCLHWPNPLIWRCADIAENDLECLNDQRVLEALDGEERREYGMILLSMANERYAKLPGVSALSNGGRNLRQRVECIARFKLYPRGMAMASVCIILVLLAAFAGGTRATALYKDGRVTRREDPLSRAAVIASARTIACKTPDGAMDAYAKAVLSHNGAYRALCAPLSEHPSLYELPVNGSKITWEGGPEGYIDYIGYSFLNLTETERGLEGTLSVGVSKQFRAVQRILTYDEGGRYVVIPLGPFEKVKAWDKDVDTYMSKPYSAEYGGLTVTVFTCSESYMAQNGTRYSEQPETDGEFTCETRKTVFVRFSGAIDEAAKVSSVGVSVCPMEAVGERPELEVPRPHYSSSWTTGGSAAQRSVTAEDLLSGVEIGGHGTTAPGVRFLPDCYACDLYLNGEKAAELILLPEVE